MIKEQLSKLFADLRSEIEQMEQLEQAAKEKVDHLIQQGRHQLEQPAASDYQHFGEQVEDAIAHFEVSHPRLTGILNEIMTTLSNAGI